MFTRNESTWKNLLKTNNIDLTHLSKDQKNILIQWCREHVKSNVQENISHQDLKILMDVYDKLVTKDVTEIVDKKLQYTTLHLAARHGCDHLVRRFHDDTPHLVSNLLVNNTAVNLQTPLHLSIVGGNIELVKLLLEIGAPTSTQNKLGLIPLQFAELCLDNNTKSQYLEIVKLLTLYTSSEDIQSSINTNTGENILMSLLTFNDFDIVRELMEKAPNLINGRDNRFHNVLHYAIVNNCTSDILYYLLSNDSQLSQDILGNGDTILIYACRHSSKQTIKNIISVANLIEKNINNVNEHDYTALDYLIERFPNSELIGKLEILGATCNNYRDNHSIFGRK